MKTENDNAVRCSQYYKDNKEERLRKLKEKGYEDGTAPQSAIEEVDAEIRDRFKKAAITGKVGEEKLQNVLTVQGVRESLKDFVTSVPVMGTSEYKERREKEGGFVERGVIGLAGSLPAMVGNRYLRLANMFMMTTDAVMQEMDNDPSFANVSENEKELIAAPIGVIGAALEEIGLRNLIKGTSITSALPTCAPRPRSRFATIGLGNVNAAHVFPVPG